MGVMAIRVTVEFQVWTVYLDPEDHREIMVLLDQQGHLVLLDHLDAMEEKVIFNWLFAYG